MISNNRKRKRHNGKDQDLVVRSKNSPKQSTGSSSNHHEPRHRPTLPERKETAVKNFLTEKDGIIYRKLLEEHYSGFALLPASQISPQFHQSSKVALEKLRDAGYYQYDMVMAGGTNLSRTFVERTLVGDPGITCTIAKFSLIILSRISF